MVALRNGRQKRHHGLPVYKRVLLKAALPPCLAWNGENCRDPFQCLRRKRFAPKRQRLNEFGAFGHEFLEAHDRAFGSVRVERARCVSEHRHDGGNQVAPPWIE